jgi:RNA polymerase sigma-70 factor (ECF subfamily)
MKQHSARQSVESLVGDRSPLAVDETLLQAVRQVRAGIEVDENFQIIDARLRPRLLSFFRAYYFSHEDAEDLVQKTLARVYLGVQQLAQEKKFVPWLFTIARNVKHTAVEQRQRESQWMAGGIELAEELPDPRSVSWSYDQQLDERRLEAVRVAIEALPAQQRQCLLLRVREELSYDEIAEMLRLSVNTVRNHLAEARKNLRRMLKTEFEEDMGL